MSVKFAVQMILSDPLLLFFFFAIRKDNPYIEFNMHLRSGVPYI